MIPARAFPGPTCTRTTESSPTARTQSGGSDNGSPPPRFQRDPARQLVQAPHHDRSHEVDAHHEDERREVDAAGIHEGDATTDLEEHRLRHAVQKANDRIAWIRVDPGEEGRD